MLTIISPDTGKKIQIAENDLKIRVNWKEAKKACNKLGVGWRLPTIYEFDVICNEFYKKGIGNLQIGCYWSGSELSQTEAWYFNFEVVELEFDEESSLSADKKGEAYVRAVRDL